MGQLFSWFRRMQDTWRISEPSEHSESIRYYSRIDTISIILGADTALTVLLGPNNSTKYSSPSGEALFVCLCVCVWLNRTEMFGPCQLVKIRAIILVNMTRETAVPEQKCATKIPWSILSSWHCSWSSWSRKMSSVGFRFCIGQTRNYDGDCGNWPLFVPGNSDAAILVFDHIACSFSIPITNFIPVMSLKILRFYFDALYVEVDFSIRWCYVYSKR